ncbi:MAG: PAS domain S-box protein [Gemmataceae bacterium]
MRSSVAAYGVAVAATATMVLLRWFLDPWLGDNLPLVTLYGAIAAAVWYGGYRPAIVATVLGYLACNYLFIEPRGSFAIHESHQYLGLVLNLFTCALVIGFGEATRVSRRRYEELAGRHDPFAPPTSATIESIRQKHSLRDIVVINFVLLLAVLAAGGVLGVWSASRLADNERLVVRTHEVIGELENLLSTLKDAETGQRGYLLTEDPKYLEPYEDALGRVQAVVAHLKELTSDSPDQQARLAALEEKTTVRLDELKQTVALMRKGDRPAAIRIVRANTGKATMDDLRRRVGVMRQAEEALLERRAEESAASFRITILAILLPAGFAVALVCGVFYLSQRNLVVRQRAAEALAEQQERLRTTLASIGDAVIATDAEGRITYLNAVAESVTGWPHHDALGKLLDAVFHIVNEETRQPVDNPATRALRQGVVVGLANHTVLIRRDGTELPIDDSAAPIRSIKGEVVGCVLVFRDITERRQAEAAQSQLAVIVASSEDAIFSKDLNGVLTSWNRGAERLYGYTAEEVVGKSVSLLIPPDLPDEAPGIMERLKRGERIERYETVRVRKDGQRVEVALSVSPMRNSSGELLGASVIAQDITARKRVEKALKAKEAELDLVISRTPLLLIRCSRDLRYAFVNRAAADFLGRRAEDVIHHPIAEIMGPDAFATIKPYIERVLRGETVDFESEIAYARVGRRFMRVQYTPDRDESGHVIGWISTIVDVTERKQLERERDARAGELAVALGKRTEEARRAEKAEQMLREADRRKDEFIATLAHELRNPLAPLRNALELLRRTDDDKPLMEQARSMMERQVSQIVRLVDDLLDISRITQGKLQVRKERVSLADVLNAAIETARPLIDASAHELTIALPPQALHLHADPIRLAQAFSNLLNNAAKYTEKAGHIWLTAERRGDQAVVSVRDTGIGIAAEHMPHIFKIFSQMTPALERSQGGLGIGLSLVKGLVELHGGTIEARSAGVGKGSEFTIQLPIVDVPVEAPPKESDAPRRGPGRRVLVVDDLRDSADSMATLLRMMGHEARTAYDGLEAVQTAAAFQPNIVLLDIGLPKMNGYEVARRIRHEPWGGNVALIAMTGWGQDEDKRQSLEAGFDHHLTKPVETAALEKLLAGLAPVPHR